MKATELIEELEWAISNANGKDVEVRMAQQPKWAFEYSVDAAVSINTNEEPTEDNKWVVYLSEGSQIGYLPEHAATELGW
tara:strand:- start:2104 stop:2343 length:240 start_codon:yes stop_codon:yes gene_type:complete